MTAIKKLVVAAVAAAACGPALAEETGVYAGFSLGQASYREACHDFDRVAGVAGAFNCLNKEDSAGKVFAGWRFSRYLAAELSYIDYGEAKETGSVGGAPVAGASRAKAAGISALGILPVTGGFSVLGRLGLLEVRSRTTVGGAVDDDQSIEMHVGIGGLFEFSGGWGIRAEYERVNDTRIDLFSLGVQYLF